MGKFIDMTGQKYGELTVLYRNKEIQQQKHSNTCYWHCICSCGNEVDVIGTALRNGHTKSCGHLAKQTQIQALNIQPGQRFGRLTVLQRVKISSRNSLWECKCDCGTIKTITGHCLTAGITKSCGCLQEENRHLKAKDITGQKFGMLTAIRKLDADEGKTYKWLCKCDCGNECITLLDYLIQGNKISCGCKRLSNGENIIKTILDENNILYEQEKTFSSCKFPESNCLLRFDFYLPQYNTIIEFDGAQHFNFINSGWNTEENYINTHKRDLYKNQWCVNNDIILKRIPYTQIKDITFENLMSDKFVMKEDYYEQQQ